MLLDTGSGDIDILFVKFNKGNAKGAWGTAPISIVKTHRNFMKWKIAHADGVRTHEPSCLICHLSNIDWRR